MNERTTIDCENCKGTGSVDWTSYAKSVCFMCGGSGTLLVNSQKAKSQIEKNADHATMLINDAIEDQAMNTPEGDIAPDAGRIDHICEILFSMNNTAIARRVLSNSGRGANPLETRIVVAAVIARGIEIKAG
jgi:DnaJ-class molecular chaperone